MAEKWFLGCFLVLFLACKINCQEGPPVITGSYKAIGEMVETLEDGSNILTQIAFEETYDTDRDMAAFRVWLVGMNVTFVENFVTNQTFQLNETGCAQITVNEWIKTPSPPSLTAYEDINGTVRFSLKQLFALDNRYLKSPKQSTTFRGIPANKWMYEIRGQDSETSKSAILNIYAFWSDGSWNTSSSSKIVPLGYIVTRMNYTKGDPRFEVHKQFINVFGFEPGITDPKLLEPIQGYVCPDRKPTIPFPDTSRMQAVELRSEVIVPTDSEIRYVDTWVDTKNKIIRTDLERIDLEVPVFEDKTRKYESEIAIADLGIVYRVSYWKGASSCEVIAFKDYKHDPQTLFNIKLAKQQWDVAKLFGRNQTNYVYIGKTYKRDVPCHMFQGLRTDWPEPSSGVESLWEWCFATTDQSNMTQTKKDNIIFKNQDYGLVHAQFRIQTSADQIYYPGLEMKHHFYKVQKQESDIMQATVFDIIRCFGQNERRPLQFIVDWPLDDKSEQFVEKTVANRTFLTKWKNMLYSASGMKPYSLRITKLYATIVDKKMYVRFTILSPHKDLPSDIKKGEKTAFQAEEAIRDKINKNGGLFVSFRPSDDMPMLKLMARKKSLELQVKTDFEEHTTPSTTTKESKGTSKIPFSLRTDPEDETTQNLKSTATSGKPVISTTRQQPDFSSTSQQTDGPSTSQQPETTTPKKTKVIEELKKGGHGPSTVAGVSIAMLLIGISLGSTGIFIKMNGLPSCLKSG
ncbi:unnamed protein product [Larinioides sclopetarius]|uniref:LolA-like domain-containing protein n=1 Tax=Larinioides sclopetarius TaxID=280406 RepID=A0AAV2BKI1_9ARAC